MDGSVVYLQTFFLRRKLEEVQKISQELARYQVIFASSGVESVDFPCITAMVQSFHALIGSLIETPRSCKGTPRARYELPNELAINLYYIHEISGSLMNLLCEIQKVCSFSSEKKIQFKKDTFDKLRLISNVVEEITHSSEEDSFFPKQVDKALLN